MDSAQLLARHLDRFARGDVDALLSEYDDDFVMFTRDAVVRDRATLRCLFEDMIAEFSQPDVSIELLITHAAGDAAYIVWTAVTPRRRYEMASDTFVFRDGKIIVQSSAMTTAPHHLQASR